MTRKLLRSTAFIKAARRTVKKNPALATPLALALSRLSADYLDSRLRSHKLKGALKGRWAATVTYDLRIVYRLVEQGRSEAILLLSLGSHDEVY